VRREIRTLGERLEGTPERLRLAAERVHGTAQRIDQKSILAISERVEQTGALIAEHAKRRIETTRRDTEHLLALIAARDFRTRGWLLASTRDGAPIRSATDLKAGQAIQLRLHDGTAQARIDAVNHESEMSTQ
jgi:exonuclease VII large subunit